MTFNFCVDHRGRLQRSAHLQGAKSQMMKTWQKVKIVFFFCTKIFISFIHCIYISIQPSLWKNVTISCRGVCLYFKADSEQCVSFDYSVFFSLAHSHRVVLTGAEATGWPATPDRHLWHYKQHQQRRRAGGPESACAVRLWGSGGQRVDLQIGRTYSGVGRQVRFFFRNICHACSKYNRVFWNRN